MRTTTEPSPSIAFSHGERQAGGEGQPFTH